MSEIPATLAGRIAAYRPGRGVYGYQPLLAGMVDTQDGPAFVELRLMADLPGHEAQPTQLAIHFATEDHPTGVAFHVDVTDLLEDLARAYFDQRPLDRPAPPPDIAPQR